MRLLHEPLIYVCESVVKVHDVCESVVKVLDVCESVVRCLMYVKV